MSDYLREIVANFDAAALARVCAMPEAEFGAAYGMTRVAVAQPAPEDFYYFRDNGASVLAVAHLDTVADAGARTARFVNSEAGPVVFSRALDDRLGAYIILELLPRLGLEFDYLLTTGEECGMSTAAYFDAPRQYDWVIEFDRGGNDVVMYQYDDADTRALVEECGADVGQGSFSDIAFLEHLGVKCFNWGTGYQDYHGPRSHAFLADTFEMVEYFVDFYLTNDGVYLAHDAADDGPMWSRRWSGERGSHDCVTCGAIDSVWGGYCTACAYCHDCKSEEGDCMCSIGAAVK